MIFSRPLLGTNTNKTSMSWIEYIWFSCILQGWTNCFYAFQNWKDLIFNEYEGYGVLAIDDDLEHCILCFWDSLEDDIYPKDFLEELMQMAYDVQTGKVETIPFDRDMFDHMTDLVNDIEGT